MKTRIAICIYAVAMSAFGLATMPEAKPIGEVAPAVVVKGDPQNQTMSLTGKTAAGVWVGPEGKPNKGVSMYYVPGQGTCFVIFDYDVKTLHSGAQFAISLDDNKRPVFQVASKNKLTHIPVDDLAEMWEEWKTKKAGK